MNFPSTLNFRSDVSGLSNSLFRDSVTVKNSSCSVKTIITPKEHKSQFMPGFNNFTHKSFCYLYKSIPVLYPIKVKTDKGSKTIYSFHQHTTSFRFIMEI